jgi:hypothetical protein
MNTTVTIEFEGRTYTGEIEIKDDRVTVISPLGRETAPIGDTAPADLARAMLRELAEDARKRQAH